MIVGWRFWRVTGGELVPPFGHAASVPEPWQSGWNVAVCHRGEGRVGLYGFMSLVHPADAAAPVRRCVCGIAATATLPSLVGYLHRCWRSPSLAIAQVETGGVVFQGSRALGDPRDTLRSERARITGPLYLSPATANQGGLLSKRLGVMCIAGSGDSWWDRLSGVVARTAQECVVLPSGHDDDSGA